MNNPNQSEKQRFLYIDIARCVAMLWIVGWWHLIQYSPNYERFSFQGDEFITNLMLGLFMFLSGLLLGRKEINNWNRVKEFYKNRFLRFYILYAISALTFPVIGYNREPALLFTTLTATSSIFLPQPVTLWFMSMLAFFYLLTPLIKKQIVLLGGALLLIFIILHFVIHQGVDTRLFLYFPLYVSGLGCAQIRTFYKIIGTKICLALSFVLSCLLFYFTLRYSWMVYVFVPAGVVFVLSLSHMIEFEFLKPVVSFLAFSSLCAYLFHRQIYAAVCIGLEFLGFNHPLWVCFLLLFPICILCSYFLQKMYDLLLGFFKK